MMGTAATQVPSVFRDSRELTNSIRKSIEYGNDLARRINDKLYGASPKEAVAESLPADGLIDELNRLDSMTSELVTQLDRIERAIQDQGVSSAAKPSIGR